MKTFEDSPILGKFTPEQEPTRRNELIDAYWAGNFGDVEFMELALEAGMDMAEIDQVMCDVREEDGTL